MDKEELLKTIEKLRKEMHGLMLEKGLVDEEIIKKSQELDKLLNEYQRLLKNED